ncbi:hypothetical protein ACJ41O_001571 [Fusarium nematophilum]
MLARSASSTETELSNVVKSAAAVIFLGTPHRGSPDLAALGEWVRSAVSTLRMETTSAILDALGLKTTDLERAQEAFSEVWQKYDFRVKTFQEGLGLSGINLGVLGNKVVPDYSSLIGDHREHAETLQASHLDMCRCSGPNDSNYRKLAGELRSVYLAIARLPAVPKENPGSGLDEADKACIQSLWFPNINTRPQSLGNPTEHTCHWLFNHDVYQNWLNSRNRRKHHGLLWLKGKPGAGKSTLIKEAFRRAAMDQDKSGYCTAAFFFSAKGHELEHSPIGLFRSLLHQLLPKNWELLQRFKQIWAEKKVEWDQDQQRDGTWGEAELQPLIEYMFTTKPAAKTVIFIDALDECDPESIRPQAYFWRKITKSAHAAGVHLNVCLSSRHFPSVTVSDCPEIFVEHHNSHDIATYVEQRFELGIAAQEPQWEYLRDSILDKSAGVFLWAVLVVDEMLRSWDDGKDLRYLLKQMDVLPEALETLFAQLFTGLGPETRDLTMRLFRWAILAAKPLRVYEWHHVLAFIRQPAPSSLHEWRTSDNFTQTDDQLERQIRSISKGLVEVKKTAAEEPQDHDIETMSVFAGAGSLNQEQGETRVVQVIHESVRDFFLRGNGFSILDPGLKSHPIGRGHLSIMVTCLDYLDIPELDALVRARTLAAQQETAQPEEDEARAGMLSFTQVSTSLASLDSPESLSSTGSKPGRARVLETLSLHSRQSYRIRRDASPRTRSLDHYLTPFDGPTTASPARETQGILEASISSSRRRNVDIAQWLATSQPISESLPLGRSPKSITDISFAGRSQVLEDYPALLSYATFELFTHARLADENGADPQAIINRIQAKQSWDRWITLREDIPGGIQLVQYAADNGLDSWVHMLSEDLTAAAQDRAERLRSLLLEQARTKYQEALKPALQGSFDQLFSFVFDSLMRKYHERFLESFMQSSFDEILQEVTDVLNDVLMTLVNDVFQDPDHAPNDAKLASILKKSAQTVGGGGGADSGHHVRDKTDKRRVTSPTVRNEAPKTPAVQRRGSVASFSSASSHTGSLYAQILRRPRSRASFS